MKLCNSLKKIGINLSLEVIIISRFIFNVFFLAQITESELWVGLQNPNLKSDCWDSSSARDPDCDNDVFYWADGTAVTTPRESW